ncbi:MAG: flagellar hook-basal body protein [Syntrophales bacterium]
MENTIQQVVDRWNQRIDQLDAITSNLANAGSLGYKSFRIQFNELTDASPASGPVDKLTTAISTDFSRGAIQATGNPLDVAIEGEGFFAVQTASGIAYTRRGNFSVNKKGDLVNDSGEDVLSTSGSKINITGGTVEIGGEGDVFVDGRKVDNLKVVKFADKAKLERLPGSLFRDPGTAGPTEEKRPEIHAEHVETSNVNVVSEMVQMINVQRMIEFYQKNMLAISEMDKISSNRVGRLYS